MDSASLLPRLIFFLRSTFLLIIMLLQVQVHVLAVIQWVVPKLHVWSIGDFASSSFYYGVP